MSPALLFAARIIALATAVATLALMAKIASWSWQGAAFMIGLMTWAASPYALLAWVMRRPRDCPGAAITLFVTTLAVALFAVVVYADTVFFHPDAQGGLVFLFIPLWQWVGAAAGLIVASQLDVRARVNDRT